VVVVVVVAVAGSELEGSVADVGAVGKRLLGGSSVGEGKDES